MPVRARRPALLLQRGAAGALPAPALGAVPRSLRPPGARSPRPSRATRPGEPSDVVRERVCAAPRSPAPPLRRLAVVDERGRARERRGAAPPAARRGARGVVRPGRGAAAHRPRRRTRIRRVARTLADLDGAADITDAHVESAALLGATSREPPAHVRTSRAAPPLDPVQVAAATLACLPGITVGAPARPAGAPRWPGRRARGGRSAVRHGDGVARTPRPGPACPEHARRAAIPRVRARPRRLPGRRRAAGHARGAARRGRGRRRVRPSPGRGGRHARGDAARPRRRARDRRGARRRRYHRRERPRDRDRRRRARRRDRRGRRRSRRARHRASTSSTRAGTPRCSSGSARTGCW